MTQQKFIEKANLIHNNKYDYSILKYDGALNYVEIICPKHGIFKKIASEHIRKRNVNHGGCYKCSLANSYNTKSFVEKCQKIHNYRYDYSLVDYEKNNKKVKILCKEHGVFEQTPNRHLAGQGCSKCAGNMRLTKEEFVKKSEKIHCDKYDYSMVLYNGNKIKVKIICKIHGIFSQTPNSHLLGQGCPKCSNNLIETEDFILKSNIIHENKYDYSKTVYEKSIKKVIIICPIHGEFKQKPVIHSGGSGCQKCSESKGERKIDNFLKHNNIDFEKQKTFDSCINPDTGKCLKFDFFLKRFNLLIEYDGEYHFYPWRFGSNQKKSIIEFEKVKLRDEIKNEYAKNNKINLLRIPYTHINDIENIINDYLLKKEKICQ